jgi:heme oxygenase (mycobilin-producing)
VIKLNVHITTGTYDFLNATKEKHLDVSLVLMQNEDHALLFHETKGTTFFTTSRKYELIATIGLLREEGFVAMNHVPVTDEGKPLFEHHIKKLLPLMESIDGFIALRFLKPVNTKAYILLTSWKNEKSFKSWQNSQIYLKTFETSSIDSISKIFSTGSYISTYFISKENEKNK